MIFWHKKFLTSIIFKPGVRPQLAIGWLWACPWFPEIVLQKVCVFVCMYICLYFHTHVSKPFTWSLKVTCIQTLKAKQNLYYIQVCTGKLSFEGMFLSQLKTRRSDHPQTSKPAFLVNFSCVLQPKNSLLGLMGLQGLRISSFRKWAWPVLTWTKMKSSTKALLEEF